jgi:DNA-binding winged helix-turn-helix (wHTH) protein
MRGMPQNRGWEFGPYRFDGSAHVLSKNGQVLAISPRTAELFSALLKASGEVVSKEALMQAVWQGAFVEEGNLTQHISLLRKVLGLMPDGRAYIETYPKRGYRFAGTLEEAKKKTGGAFRMSSWQFGVAAAILLLAATAATMAAFHRPAAETVAVAHFVNLSGDPSQDGLADRFTQSLRAELGHFSWIQVMPENSEASRRQQSRMPGLTARLLVEGKILRSGERVQVQVSVIRSEDGAVEFSETYSEELQRLKKVEREVAVAVASSLMESR